MTVDMIIWRDESRTEFLVGTKPKDPRWRLPGGFVDNGETLEEAALREIHEETYIDFASLSSLSYKSSYRIHDWRYEPLGMAITTAFFSCVAPIGYRPRPGDDLNTLKWQSLQEFKVMVNSGQIDESKWVISHTKMIKDFL
ncbi:NUDIX hydrolase [Candidatus Pacearchaeota archaeon]|nr:NUDIX hydrolase [Candidatus Pacearchaeota archaeon]